MQKRGRVGASGARVRLPSFDPGAVVHAESERANCNQRGPTFAGRVGWFRRKCELAGVFTGFRPSRGKCGLTRFFAGIRLSGGECGLAGVSTGIQRSCREYRSARFPPASSVRAGGVGQRDLHRHLALVPQMWGGPEFPPSSGTHAGSVGRQDLTSIQLSRRSMDGRTFALASYSRAGGVDGRAFASASGTRTGSAGWPASPPAGGRRRTSALSARASRPQAG